MINWFQIKLINILH